MRVDNFIRATSQTDMGLEELRLLCLLRPYRMQTPLRLNSSHECICSFSVFIISQIVEMVGQDKL